MKKTIAEMAEEYADTKVTPYLNGVTKRVVWQRAYDEYMHIAIEQQAIDGWHPATEHPEQDLEVIVMRYDCSCDSLVICFAHIVDKAVAVDYDGWNIPDVKCWMYCPDMSKYK